MKRSEIVPLIIVAVLVLLACFKLLPLTYLLLLTFLLLMCGVLIYCYPVKGSLWTSATLLILFGLFSMYQLHIFAFSTDVQASLYIEPMTLVWILVVGWMVFSSVELLHWAFNVWDRIGDHRKPVAH